MAAAPQLLSDTRSKAPKKWVIRIGDESGSTPTAEDETRLLRAPVVHYHSSGGSMDYIELTYDLSVNGERVQDMGLSASFARQIEVVEIGREKDAPPKLIAWGELTQEGKRVAPDGESVTYIAGIKPYHFGLPLDGMVYRQHASPHAAITHPGEILFNPEVNSKIEFNRSASYTVGAGTESPYYWVDPDSVRTAVARSYTGDAGTEWTLTDVVNALCWHCNPSETFIKNPTYLDFEKWMTNAPKVKNLRLKPGQYLSDLLDQTLNPYGYAWCFTYGFDSETVDDVTTYTRRVSFRIFRESEGPKIKLFQQKAGDTTGAKHTLSSTTEWTLDTDISAARNKVVVNGALVEREITVELYRGWPEADDSLTSAQLTQSTGTHFEDHQSAWRLWVANEGGDYCSTRSSVRPIPSTPLDLSSVLGANTVPRRRTPLDCLTHYEDDASAGSRRQRPPFLQWYNADNAWKPLPNGWGETVLTDQYGIYFAGDAPPADLIARGENARIRMTCTVRGDTPLQAVSLPTNESINARTNQITIDASDRFFDRQIQTTGDYVSVLAGVPSSEERDDSTAIDDFADQVKANEDLATQRASATILGLNLQYGLGKVVEKVQGRNVSFSRNAKDAVAPRYLQIRALTLNHQQQTTTISVEPASDRYEGI